MKLKNINNTPVGFAIALVFSLLVIGVVYLLNLTLIKAWTGREALSYGTIFVIGLVANIIPATFYNKQGLLYTLRGIVTYTIVGAAAYIVLFLFLDL